MGEAPIDIYDAIDQIGKSSQDILEALHIMQSTVDYIDDPKSLEINKKKMIKYMDRFASTS